MSETTTSTRTLDLTSLAPYAHWPVRVAAAAIFLFHGIGKFQDGIGMFATMMDLPVFVAGLVAIAEVAGGLGIVLGGVLAGRHASADWITRSAGLAILVVMLGAIALVHAGQWSFVASDSHPMGGMEFQVLLAAVGAYFLMKGNA